MFTAVLHASRRRHFHDSPLTQPSPSYAEPVAISSQTSYFQRRTLRPAAAAASGSLTTGLSTSGSSGNQQEFCGGAGSVQAGGRVVAGADTSRTGAQDAAGATFRPSKRMLSLPVHQDR